MIVQFIFKFLSFFIYFKNSDSTLRYVVKNTSLFLTADYCLLEANAFTSLTGFLWDVIPCPYAYSTIAWFFDLIFLNFFFEVFTLFFFYFSLPLPSGNQ